MLPAGTASSGGSWPARPGAGRPPGAAVCILHAGDRAVLVGEEDLIGPMAELVTTIFKTGDPA